jgi:hypothetical protein
MSARPMSYQQARTEPVQRRRLGVRQANPELPLAGGAGFPAAFPSGFPRRATSKKPAIIEPLAPPWQSAD